MNALWNLICSAFRAIFCRDTVSKVWKILFNTGRTAIGDLLSNEAIMDAAYDYAAAQLQSDASAADKASTFDRLMRDYLTSQGIAAATSAINVIRETAVAAVKAEQELQSCGGCCDCQP